MINPELYENCDLVVEKDVARFVSRMIERMDWKDKTNVLDFGCGPGRKGVDLILPQVKKFNGTMYSMDNSREMIEFAKVHHPSGLIQYACGDILGGFPFQNTKMNVIFSIYVFWLIEDIESVLKALSSILAPGGQLGFLTVTAETWIIKMFDIIANSPKWKDFHVGYKQFKSLGFDKTSMEIQTMYKGLLEQAGLEIELLEVTENCHNNYYEDINKLLDFCLSITPFLENIPVDRIQELREDYRKVITDIAGIPLCSKSITLKYETVLGVCRFSGN